MKPHIFYRDGQWLVRPGWRQSMNFYAWEWVAER